MQIRLILMFLIVVFSSNNLSTQSESTIVLDTLPTFYSEDLPLELQKRMKGVSYHVGAPVELSDLRVVHITYVDFENQNQQGQFVVHARVAEEVLDIFNELYEARYPIAGIQLIEDFNGDDALSMEANNTSAFNHRVVQGSSHLSLHAYGLAIDINPIQNPYVTAKGVYPPIGEAFIDRSTPSEGMIIKGDICYQAFVSRGWQWGGDFKSVKDYQHFQKKEEDLMQE